MKTPAFLAPLLRRDAGPCHLVNQRGQVIASEVHAAFDSKSRRKGLLGRDSFEDGHAIVIAPCNAVHTFFMRFPIDVVHLDRGGRVVRVKVGLKPWRIDTCLRGFAVVELPPGTVNLRDVRTGDVLSVAMASTSTGL